MQNSDGMKKIKNACEVNDTARSTNDSTGPWQPLKGISINKTYMFPNYPTPPLKNIYINLKGLYLTKNIRACGVIDTAFTIFEMK
jgi:hypothetical protein